MPAMDKATGRAKGGLARAESLSKKRRKDIATKAATARWSGDIKQATHGSDDHPLKIGEIEIPCYVLEDETRVLSQRGLQGSLGLSEGGGRGGARKIAALMVRLAEKDIDVRGLVARANSPIRFILPRGGAADGYDAKILPDICAVLIEAGRRGVLGKVLEPLAARAAILQHGFATLGIIALVDEATGFQRDRAKDALTKILEAFIAKELQPWLPTFPSDFYQEMFRLRGMEYPNDTLQRPRYFGLLTNNIVYDRLAPGVLDELKKVNPKHESGRRKHKHFQWLTSNRGYPKLREHLGAVMATMKLSSDWHEFIAKLNKHYPPQNKPTQLSMEFANDEPDTGKGL
jgi:hypothetical protein